MVEINANRRSAARGEMKDNEPAPIFVNRAATAEKNPVTRMVVQVRLGMRLIASSSHYACTIIIAELKSWCNGGKRT